MLSRAAGTDDAEMGSVVDARVPARPIYGTALSLMHWAGCEDAGWTLGRRNGAANASAPA